jgi:L-ascorbate metabolism protein UlaG (beta-lactamase superfamily)
MVAAPHFVLMDATGITWLGHATALVEMDGARVLTDPLLRGRVGPLVRVPPPVEPDAARRIDIVLLSHLHADHADPASLRRIGPSPTVIAPYGAGSWLRRRGMRDVRELRAGEGLDLGPLRVDATTATHARGRHRLGPAADPIGFMVHGSHGVYFAGDTDLFDGMSELGGALDAALLPVWGWGSTLGPGHLDPPRAAHAAALIAPRVAIPIHWGTFALPRLLRGQAASDKPALEFAALVTREAPGVEVRVLQPGQRTTLN